PINDAREIAASTQLAAREFFVEVENPGRGRLRYPGAFARSNATAIGIRRPAPRLGEHTAEVLGELGLGAAELERLRAEGVVRWISSPARPSSNSAAAQPARSRRATSRTTARPC